MRKSRRPSLVEALYSEIIFQSMTTFRLGGFLKDMRDSDPVYFVSKVKQAYLLNTVFASLMFAIYPFLVYGGVEWAGSGVSPLVLVSIVHLGYVFLMAFAEVENAVGTRLLRPREALAGLPVGEEEVARAIVFAYARIYRAPVLAFAASSTALVLYVTGSPILGILNVLLALLSTFYAISLSTIFGVAFARALKSRKGAGRLLVALLASLTTGLLVATPVVIPNIVRTVLSSWIFRHPLVTAIAYSIYPAPLLLLARGGSWLDASVILASVAYVTLGYFSFVYMKRSLYRLLSERDVESLGMGSGGRVVLKTTRPVLALAKRYVKTAIQYPAYGAGFTLPIGILVLNAVLGNTDIPGIFTQVTVAMIAYPLIVLGIEAHGRAFTRTLPVSNKAIGEAVVLLGVTEVALIYLGFTAFCATFWREGLYTALSMWFTIPLVASAVMVEIIFLLLVEGENVFTGSFYTKLSKTTLIYILLYFITVLPTWVAYYIPVIAGWPEYSYLLAGGVSIIQLIASAYVFHWEFPRET